MNMPQELDPSPNVQILNSFLLNIPKKNIFGQFTGSNQIAAHIQVDDEKIRFLESSKISFPITIGGFTFRYDPQLKQIQILKDKDSTQYNADFEKIYNIGKYTLFFFALKSKISRHNFSNNSFIDLSLIHDLPEFSRDEAEAALAYIKGLLNDSNSYLSGDVHFNSVLQLALLPQGDNRNILSFKFIPRIRNSEIPKPEPVISNATNTVIKPSEQTITQADTRPTEVVSPAFQEILQNFQQNKYSVNPTQLLTDLLKVPNINIQTIGQLLNLLNNPNK